VQPAVNISTAGRTSLIYAAVPFVGFYLGGRLYNLLMYVDTPTKFLVTHLIPHKA